MSKKPTFSELRIYQSNTEAILQFKLPYDQVHDFITDTLQYGYKFVSSGGIFTVIPVHMITKITATGIDTISKD